MPPRERTHLNKKPTQWKIELREGTERADDMNLWIQLWLTYLTPCHLLCEPKNVQFCFGLFGFQSLVKEILQAIGSKSLPNLEIKYVFSEMSTLRKL